MTELPQQETLHKIGALVRAGRLDAAAMAVAQAVMAQPDDPVLQALGGAIACRRGHYPHAIPYLRNAQSAHPNDWVVRANLANALFHTGDHAAARALCDEESALADPSLRLARLGGHLAQQADDNDLAVRLYRHVLKHDAADWVSWNNLGNALAALEDHSGAVVALTEAVKLAPDAPPIRINLGNTLLKAKRAEEAEAVFRQAAKDFPQDPHPLLSLFHHYGVRGQHDAAFAALSEAVRRAPERADIQADFALAAGHRNDFATAQSAYEAALASDPTLTAAYVGLAGVYERMNREGELDPLRARAEQHKADPRAIAFIDALRWKRSHDYAEALAALDAAGEEVVTPNQRLYLRGALLDRLGRSDEAFAAFAETNRLSSLDPSDPRGRARIYRANIARETALLTPEWVGAWRPYAPTDSHKTPIFLLGFPRSGTTLLDTMLMAEPRVRVLEEVPIIAEILEKLGGMAALPHLTQAVLDDARALYFAEAGALTSLNDDTIIVDKHPMHLVHAPIIHRLFPQSRFILALRHPCDVLLSCFLTNFRLNDAMSNFLDLEDAAELYELAFGQWEKARALLSLRVGTMVYERLVADPEAELRPLFDWLRLAYPDGGLDHRAAARARGTVTTASYAQVTEPIYKRAAGRWRRYTAQLTRIIPRLMPWIEHFGYGEDAIPSRPTSHPCNEHEHHAA